MAGVVQTARASARAMNRYASTYATRRGFRVSAHERAAHNFSMPALSPTMTEGNIAAWRVKEGDSFSAGDVLLEIETDKATMDVEAQDDGIMVKVIAQEGSKGVKVGNRIAVTAEPGGDNESLEIPAEESSTSSTKPSKPEPEQKKSQEQPAEKEKSKSESKSQKQSSKPESSASAQGGTARKQKYPLYPSVEHLLHQNGMSSEEAGSIPATGPGGRLLKGDVLAYLGQINKQYPAKSSERINKLAHLDLSNIQIAKPQPKSEDGPKATAAKTELPKDVEVVIPISLSNVIATQKRVQDTLGIFLPLSTFIARASELANEDLPRSQSHTPTADELFNSVLGLDQLPSTSRGNFVPSISGITPLPPPRSSRSKAKPDIIDLLTSTPKKASKAVPSREIGISTKDNIFSVTTRPEDETRAAEYLGRMKLTLEEEPGRLVL